MNKASDSVLYHFRRKLFTFFIILLISSTLLYGQRQNNIWYFGDRLGIDFNNDSAVLLIDGAMQSVEGCATICDSAGNLLFYTNGGPLPFSGGGGIWNKNHTLMPNGNLDSAGGCNSSNQSSLIIPYPQNQDQYFVFTTDCFENHFEGGLRYSIVDMKLDGGLGDVIIKSVAIQDSVAESLCGIRHANGIDYWIIVRKVYNNKFYIYQITNSGISLSSILTSPTNPTLSGPMKASIDGSKVAISLGYETSLFSFDNSTGILSGYQSLAGSESCEFSPNCQYLYIMGYKSPGRVLYQYNLNSIDIPSSMTVIEDSMSSPNVSMQLGANGKIYLPHFDTSLSVINKPDYPNDSCDFQQKSFHLNGRNSHFSMPNMVSGFYGNCGFFSNPKTEEPFYMDLEQSQIRVYPNPSIGNLIIESPEMDGVYRFLLFDVAGKVLKETYLESGKARILLNQRSGLYLMQIKSDVGIIYSEKLILFHKS